MFGSRSLLKDLQHRNEFLARTNRELREELADATEKAAVAEARVHRIANDRVAASRADAEEMARLTTERDAARAELRALKGES